MELRRPLVPPFQPGWECDGCTESRVLSIPKLPATGRTSNMITCDCHTLLFATERSGVWSLPLQALGAACRECHTISYDRPVDGAVYGSTFVVLEYAFCVYGGSLADPQRLQ